MARKTSKFLIGLFVIAGLSIGLIAVIWLGASRYFETGETYATYFDESVQGLQTDSTVKYRGVEIGRVEKIRVAQDNRLIEVVMKVNMKGRLNKDYVSKLKAAGITGIVFIELDRREPEEKDLSPRLSFIPRYRVIPSKPSDIKQILTGVQEVLENLKKIDVQGISNGVASIVANLTSVIENLEKTVAKGRIEEVFVKTQDTLGAMETALKEAKGTIENLNHLVETLDRRSVSITNNFKATSDNLKRASESLDRLVERVNASPSDLLFSQPPPPRKK